MSEPIQIRRAIAADLPVVARLAAELVRMHHAVDPRRFFLAEDVEGGYRWWFGRELERPEEALIFVALLDGEIVGYAYGTFEERDWNMLLDEFGAVHDLFVAEEARRHGVGARLLAALIAAVEAESVTRIVLSTMVSNENAQRLFRAHGFRPTMLEMTRGG
jgi:ribosomal protein S18 acetylase RimI-like enzyme